MRPRARFERIVGVIVLFALFSGPLTARAQTLLPIDLGGGGAGSSEPQASSEAVDPAASVPPGAFPIAWYDMLTRSSSLPAIAKEGIDTVMPYDSQSADPAAYLDTAKANGVQVLMEIPRRFVRDLDHASLTAWVARFKTHQALLGWYLADEPSIRQSVGPLSPENATALYQTIKTEDPQHPVAIAFASEEDPAAYRSAMDVMMFAYYPAYHWKPEFYGLPQWRDAVNRAASVASTEDGFFPVLQAYRENKNVFYATHRYPTRAEERYMAFSSLEAGATGLFFWARYRSEGTWITDVLKPVAAVLNQIQPALAGGRVDGQVSTAHPDIKATAFKTPDGTQTYVVAIHHGPETIDAPLTLKGALAAEPDALLLEAQRRVPVTNGQIEQSLAPYEVKVYRLDG